MTAPFGGDITVARIAPYRPETSVDNGDSETDTDFGLALGATLGTDRYYGEFTLTLSTADGNDTVSGISMGFILGQ